MKNNCRRQIKKNLQFEKKVMNYMLNGNVMIVHLTFELIRKILCTMSHYFPKPYEQFREHIDFKIDLSNYAAKAVLKNATRLDTSK